jgi:hypothetical protein
MGITLCKPTACGTAIGNCFCCSHSPTNTLDNPILPGKNISVTIFLLKYFFFKYFNNLQLPRK